MEELGVHPKQSAASEPAHVTRLHGRLQGMVQDLAELRNEHGDGHGTASIGPALNARHGRLTVWAALGWSSYMLDVLGTPAVQAQAAGN